MAIVGSRISVDGSRATVRFVGCVAPSTSDIWLGVEWDDATRGKHSGENKGVKYFKTVIPGAGSFLRETSKTIEYGKDIVNVLKDKYLSSSTHDSELNLGGDVTISVETVGWEKITIAQSKLDRLKDVGLMEMLVGSSLPGTIKNTCSNIQDLDLSKNLLGSWYDVASIAVELPILQSLRLNHNRFKVFDGLPAHLHTCFGSLSVLSLNFTMISWSEVTKLEPFLPVLNELHLRQNNITTLSNDMVSGFRKLHLLNLEDNLISEYASIESLKQLPCLSTLILAGNALTTISPSQPTDFPLLKFINLNRNEIADWSSINHLNTFPSLTEIRIKENQIVDSIENVEKRHFHLIARLAKVVILNGSEISVKRRRDAEIYYLNECVKIKHAMPYEEFCMAHPRYRMLCDVYGEPDLSLKNFEMNTVKDGLVGLVFVYEGAVIEKALPSATKIRPLKSILKRLFKIKTNAMTLSALMNGEVGLLNDDIKDLNYYDIEAGATITICC